MIAIPIALLGVLQAVAPGGGPAFPEQAVRELAGLEAGVTPAAWLAAHPHDAFTLMRRDSVRENHESWCARATRSATLPDGSHFLRYAYFYPPSPPASLALPRIEGEALIREQCVLGTVWLEAPSPDSQLGAALAMRARDLLSRLHGPVTPSPDACFGRVPTDSQRRALARLPGAEAIRLGLNFSGAAAWRVAGRWQSDSTVVVSAYDARLDREQQGRVLVFAYLPTAELGSFRRELDAEQFAERRAAALVGDAARLSGLVGPPSDRLLATLAAAESAYTGRHAANLPALDSAAVAILREWIAMAGSLPPPRRAAALLAADQFLGSRALIYVRAQRHDSTRTAFERLGAEFLRDELGGGYNYAHTWLDQALRLDSAGPVGTLATLALLRTGFNETGMCGGGEDPMHRVITAGERLLARVPPLDPRSAAEVHRLVGDAYADIVALAAGAGLEYADTATFVAEAPAARRSAIAHYRQSLVIDRDSPEARAAWLEAWRLLAGLPPTTTHFFCVYD